MTDLPDGMIWAAWRNACVGLDVTAGVITAAPPYARRHVGQPAAQVCAQLRREGATLRWIPKDAIPVRLH